MTDRRPDAAGVKRVAPRCGVSAPPTERREAEARRVAEMERRLFATAPEAADLARLLLKAFAAMSAGRDPRRPDRGVRDTAAPRESGVDPRRQSPRRA